MNKRIQKETVLDGDKQFNKYVHGDKVMGFSMPRGSMSSITESDESDLRVYAKKKVNLIGTDGK